MQLQSQPYVPVSCEYQSQPTHASADTIYPSTSTATLNANNLHHHLNLYSQTSLNNACIINQLSSNNNNNNNQKNFLNNNPNNFEHNSSNNFTTSTFFADADAQINTPTAQQNSINQSSPSKVTTPSNNIEHKNAAVTNAVAATSPDDGDSENALVQNAKIVSSMSGGDEVIVAPSGDEENQKAIIDASGIELLNNHLDDATQTSSLHSAIDENNLNANSFNSATSSSPGAAASLSALYTTSSIANNNNSILSRKNSFTTPNQHLVNSSKASTNNTLNSGKVDSVPDYASSLSNHPQAAFLSAMLYNQPYQQLAMGQSLYSDPAQMAKEMAQKNYANALKYAVAQQAQPNVAGKSPMSALSPYSGMTLSANGMVTQQPGTSASRMPTPMSQGARSYMPQLARPMQNPFQQYMRPQMPQVNLTAAATNPYYAAAAAHQQFLSQQNLLYSGMTGSMAGQQLVATSGASSTQSAYPYALTQAQAQAMNAQGMSASMMQMPQMASQPSQTSTSAVVLNPYKKMKTS